MHNIYIYIYIYIYIHTYTLITIVTISINNAITFCTQHPWSPLGLSKSYVFRALFQTFFLTVVLGVAHGAIRSSRA